MNSLAQSVSGIETGTRKCEQCGATTRLSDGMCLSCFLKEGLEPEQQASIAAFETVLAEANVPDKQWRLGNYEIIEEIGRGGMGVIYRARQRHSRRQVALKRVLTYHSDSHETLARFRREAETAATLDHPNILPIYEVSETEDGLPFFSMKLATGGSLRTVGPALRNEPRQCVQLMAKIARAIEYAHAQGILHRDLQPGNILLDARGEPLVSDFGLAKWLSEESDLTQTLTTFGTPGYIAPEQAEGGDFSPAADIYSLGAVLFNLLASRPPFIGANALSVIRQAAAMPAPKLRAFAPSLGRDLETIIARCLERDPKARYKTAGALADDLERWLEGQPIIARPVRPPALVWRWSRRNPVLAGATTACALLAIAVIWLLREQFVTLPTIPSPPEKSIAVLPFQNLSKDPENAFFADGVQDEILTSLSRVADLKVISRTSVMGYKDTARRNLREIGQQLGVANVLEGSVQRTANRVRVNAQLVDARKDTHLWAQTYDGDLTDVFAIQSQIARSIADQLRATLSAGEKAAIAKAPTTNLAAYNLYQRALPLEYALPAHENLLEGISLLDEAVRLDPNFMLAYCALTRMHLTLYSYGYDHTPARRELADKALHNAERVDKDAGEVHLERGGYWFIGFRDYDRARVELELARRKLPNNPKIYFLTGLMDHRQARWTEATRNLERAVELDPRDMENVLVTAYHYQGLHQYAEAARMFERALAISPRDYSTRLGRAWLSVHERADTRPLRSELDAILAEEPDAGPKIADTLFLCAIIERDPAATARALAAIPAEGIPLSYDFVRPREWYVGYAAQTFGDLKLARTAFTDARAIVEKIVREQPDYAEAWSLLGRIDARLGRKEEAIKEGRRACELLPLSKDTWDAPWHLRTLAEIYAWVGEKGLAIEQLSTLPQPRNWIVYGELKLDPDWDPLRGDPRFEKIVASLAPKNHTGVAVSPIPEKSIAVLPFENLSDDKTNAYFADGVQDEILSNLAKIADLKVISRTSANLYKSGRPRNAREIGEQLGVAHFLEGSVQRVGDRLRVHAQLIDARTDAHAWAQTYDRDVADLFAIQSEIAQTIAAQLQAKISSAEKAAIAEPPTSDLVANDLYLRAIALGRAQSQPELFQAVSLLEQAIARDPRFLRAYCALADMHLAFYYNGYDRTAARLKMADEAIQNATRLQPDAGEVHLIKAQYLFGFGIRDYDRAREELELARRTLPNDPAVYYKAALIDRRQGRWTEGLRNFERALESDPNNVDFLTNAAATCISMRRYAAAGQFCRRVVAIAPRDYWARVTLAFQPFYERADIRPLRKELNTILAEEPDAGPKIARDLWYCAILERDPAAADRALTMFPPQGFPDRPELVRPREWYLGYSARVFNRPEVANEAFTAARTILEKLLRDQPDNASAWSLLGRVQAALGQKEEAIKVGRRACELLPLSREPTSGLQPLLELARIYAWVGEKNLALQALEQLATYRGTIGGFNYGELRLDPDWDSLRGDPGFEEIVASLAPKKDQ